MWYQFGRVMSWVRCAGSALLIDEVGHLLGVSYALAMVAFLVSVAGLRASTATVQARTAHQRIDVLVPAVGAAATAASNAQTTANGKVSKSGDTITGSLTVNGSHNVGGNISANNFGGSYFGGQGTPGGYPLATGVNISPTTSGFANLINSIVSACANAGVM